MAIYIKTMNSDLLLSKLKKLIENNKITTWKCDNDNDFKLIEEQWENKAWLRPNIIKDSIIFGILKNKSVPFTKKIYSAYHSHFIEMLINHASEYIEDINVTPDLDLNYDTPDIFE